MAKALCAICDKEMGALSMKTKASDGVICLNCVVLVKQAKIKQNKISEYDTASLKEHIKLIAPDFFTAIEERAAFNATKNIEKYLYVDENNKKFMVGKNGVVLNYADLVGYELLEDNEAISKGGLGSAVVGGLIAGGAGAIVGSVVGGKKSKSTCDSLDIKLTVKNFHTDAIYIHFIGLLEKGIKTDSIIYRVAKDNAQKCLSALMIITDENKPTTIPIAAAVDVAAELQKFHELMKSGVITEDEFAAKKAQLLGI